FPWPGGFPGRTGLGQAAAIGFLVPAAALDFWQARLSAAGIAYEGPHARFDDQVLALGDPDGLRIELVGRAEALPPSDPGRVGVATDHAIRGFHGVTLWVNGDPGTRSLLTGPLGFSLGGEDRGRTRFVGSTPVGGVVDLLQVADASKAAGGTG